MYEVRKAKYYFLAIRTPQFKNAGENSRKNAVTMLKTLGATEKETEWKWMIRILNFLSFFFREVTRNKDSKYV